MIISNKGVLTGIERPKIMLISVEREALHEKKL